MGPLYNWALFAAICFDVLVLASVIPYAIGYAWARFDQWRESRWIVVAEGSFKTITCGVREFVHLEDGRSFLLVLDHRTPDLERGERVRVRIGHCKRHVVERLSRAA